MNNRITKFAAAAVIVIAVLLSMTFFSKTTPMTYAIEQTRDANRGVLFIHLKFEPAGEGREGVEDIWAQFDDNQELLHLRMNFPNTVDGPKDVVWQEGKAEVWFKAKKRIVVLREENMLARLKMPYKEFDPKLIVEQLYQDQNDERNQIEIQEPRSQNEPIIITLVKDDSRMVFEVDPETKLLQQYETYQIKDGEYEFIGRTKYLDYNESVDPAVFEFDPPAGVVLVGQTTQEVGMEKGTMSDEESAVKLVRQFVEAAIAQDYTKASKLLANIPAGWVEEQPYQQEQVVRLISVGKPELNAETGSLSVPCQVEVEKDGQTSVQSIVFCVQQAYGQSGRWLIINF